MLLELTLTHTQHSHACTHCIPFTHLGVFTLTLKHYPIYTKYFHIIMHLDIFTHTETLTVTHLNTMTYTWEFSHKLDYTHTLTPTNLNITTHTSDLHSLT